MLSVSLEKREEGKRIGANIGYLALFDGKGCLRFSLLCGVIIRFGGKTTLYLCTWSLRCYFCTVSASSVPCIVTLQCSFRKLIGVPKTQKKGASNE